MCNQGSICEMMSDLIGGLRPFETHLIELISEVHGHRALPGSQTLSDSVSLQLSQQASA